MLTGQPSLEYDVFIKYYSKLVDTLCNTELYQYFVSEYIITLSDLEEITSASTPSDKIRILLIKISSPLKAGLKTSFYKMLEIMRCYGNEATKALSMMISRCVSANNKDVGTLHFCQYYKRVTMHYT